MVLRKEVKLFKEICKRTEVKILVLEGRSRRNNVILKGLKNYGR